MNNKKQTHNLKALKEQRKALRNNATSAEAVLWAYLNKSQLEGRKFRRQHSVGGYILDFYCHQEQLAIELDGQHHFTPEGNLTDEERTAYLQAEGITVLRFENKMAFSHIEGVLEHIKQHFQ